MTGWVITEGDRKGYGQADEAQVRLDARFPFFHRVTVERDLDPTQIKAPVKFRLRYEDGEVEYKGVISRSWLDGDEELAFAPLNYGQADAGVTEMQYYHASQWVTL